jgi:hypothetical protein
MLMRLSLRTALLAAGCLAASAAAAAPFEADGPPATSACALPPDAAAPPRAVALPAISLPTPEREAAGSPARQVRLIYACPGAPELRL